MKSPATYGTHRAALALVLSVTIAPLADAQAASAAVGASTATPRPGARALGLWDPTLRRVVLVGGPAQLRANARDQVWSWTGAQCELVTEHGPAARGNAGIAFDAKRGAAILTGGAARSANDSSYEIAGDTWEGRPNGWQRGTGTDIAPRDHQSMVLDESRGTILLFGGIPGDRSAPWPSDTWELRPEGWHRIATEGPSGRGRTALVYDTLRRQLVLFGGVGAEPAPRQPQPFFNDTWVWERGGWRRVAEDGPRARYAHGMVFDERAGVVKLYSGAAAHRNAPLSDMWQWDGTRWTEIRLTGPTPGHRYQPVMVYDRARDRTVLFGGAPDGRNDTWEWNGQRWREILPPAR
jgi:hypothetical protein